MDDRMIQKPEQNEEVEIDLKRIFDAILKKAWLIALAAILCAAIAFGGTLAFITPMYQSSAMFYVNNSSLSVGEATLSLSSADLSASRNLVDTYVVILNTRQTLLDVIDYAGVEVTYKELKENITAGAVSKTEVFRVTVVNEDPEKAEKLANAVAYILPKRISTIIEGTSAKIVDTAVVSSVPSSPNYTKNTAIGFLIGFALTAIVVVLSEIMDVSIRVEEDIARVTNHPVLAAVPDMVAPTKGGYYNRYGYRYGYGYGNNKNKKKQTVAGQQEQVDLIGDDISFAAAEAYKLLRTKLQFSFADEKTCHVLGVSSALTGEGKSLTSVNLAFSLSQLNKRVLLIDCDMRRPSLAAKLSIDKTPGLSDFLSGQHKLEDLFQACNIKNNETAFHVIAAGQNPPNPIELLSSARMERLLTALHEHYDYVILDLPPVCEVSDALAVAKIVDGLLMVVRQNYCDRIALGSAVRQFEFVGSRLLGMIYNCTTEDGSRYGYGYRKYYRRYYNRYNKYNKYSHKYEGAYMSAKKQTKNAQKGEK